MAAYWSLSCGPEGIRTPDLLSAIEARSQLRYRPVVKAKDILLEAGGTVKQLKGVFHGFLNNPKPFKRKWDEYGK